MCRAALRGCGRRCRRRLSGILPSRGAKAELRFWRALSAANMRTIAHTLLLLVVLLQFGAVIPPVCATREREGKAHCRKATQEREGERVKEAGNGAGAGEQGREATSPSISAPGSRDRGHQQQQSSLLRQRRAASGKALGFLGQNQGLEGRSASKTAAMSCFCFALALASSLRSNPA